MKRSFNKQFKFTIVIQRWGFREPVRKIESWSLRDFKIGRGRLKMIGGQE